jgi:hypothetical protein
MLIYLQYMTWKYMFAKIVFSHSYYRSDSIRYEKAYVILHLIVLTPELDRDIELHLHRAQPPPQCHTLLVDQMPLHSQFLHELHDAERRELRDGHWQCPHRAAATMPATSDTATPSTSPTNISQARKCPP